MPFVPGDPGQPPAQDGQDGDVKPAVPGAQRPDHGAGRAGAGWRRAGGRQRRACGEIGQGCDGVLPYTVRVHDGAQPGAAAADRPTAGPTRGAANGGTRRDRPSAQTLPNPDANVSAVIAASTTVITRRVNTSPAGSAETGGCRCGW